MSGIGMALAGGGSYTGKPLSASIGISGGNSSVSVTTASGATNNLPGGGERFFTCFVSGGTPPYSYSWRRQNSGAKTSLKDSSGFQAYVAWSGMDVGEYSSVTVLCRVSDAGGEIVETNVHVIGITRVS